MAQQLQAEGLVYLALVEMVDMKLHIVKHQVLEEQVFMVAPEVEQEMEAEVEDHLT